MVPSAVSARPDRQPARRADTTRVTRITRRAPSVVALAITALSLALAPGPLAQTPPTPPSPLPYGAVITLQQARTVSAAAAAEAARHDWRAAIAIVDAGGQLVSLDRLDGAQFGSAEIARQKAWSAVAFKRPTKAFQDMLEAGGSGLRTLKLEGVMPVDGGLLLVLDGHIVGGIGVSGVLPAQDGQIAKAGADALAAPRTASSGASAR